MRAFLLTGPAIAAQQHFPLLADIDCPSAGICRIMVPVDMSATGSALLLTDPSGNPVSFARLPAFAVPERWEPVLFEPLHSEHRLSLELPGAAVSLRVSTQEEAGAAARVHAASRGGTDQDWVDGEAVSLEDGVIVPLPDPSARDVSLVGVSSSRVAEIEVGLVSALQEVPASTEVTGEWLVVNLATASRVRRLRLEGAENGLVSIVDFAASEGALRPRELGAFPLHEGTIAGLDLTARRLAIKMSAPAAVESVRAWTPRDVLLTRQSGALVLYGGTDGPSVAGLQGAAETLLALPGMTAAVGPAKQNPSHVDGLRALMRPGPTLPPLRFQFSRRINGSGVRLISLPPDVRMAARADLSGLRILDSENRQVPFVILEDVGLDPLQVEAVVSSRGGKTTLAYALPKTGLDGLVLTLRTGARGFSRLVTIRSQGHVAQRTLWTGQSLLEVELPGLHAGRLEVEIDDGLDAPLPIDTWLSMHRLSILSMLPLDSRLFYGDVAHTAQLRLPRLGRRGRPPIEPLSPPRYDLQAVALPVLLQLEGTGQLSPPAVVRLDGAQGGQRGLIRMVTTLVAALLLVVLVSLLRSEPKG